jgi:FtsH-binding integral membrane protein
MSISIESPGQTTGVPTPLLEGVEPFVRRTYAILLVSLMAIVGLGFFSYYYLPRTALRPLGIADGIIWVLCGWFGWRRPAILTLSLFSIITGLFLGQLAYLYAGVFAMAAALTLATFIGLSAYVHITKQSFSFLRGFLCISFFVLLGGGILLAFVGTHRLDLLYAGFGTFVFGCWILYDTSQILERMENDLTPEIAAFELLLDLVGFFRWLMDFLRRSD